MCGIACLYRLKGGIEQSEIDNIYQSMYRRGPDNYGYKVWKINEGNTLSLIHARLSIIDVSSAANQPMISTDESSAIIYNGEVYNFQDIKQELISLGHHFSTQSDTEVILYSYKQWGVKCVDKFIGMFAFVIADFKQNKICAFRDRTGIKPLYYYSDNHQFGLFSSIKSILKVKNSSKKINKNSLAQYLQYGYVPTPNTIINKTFKLQPGHYLEFDLLKNSYSICKYWDVYDYYSNKNLKQPSSETKLENLLTDAITKRMIADVPVGVFLSGGYDSSLVTSILVNNGFDNLNTYTIGFKDKNYDESENAKAIANHLKTKHYEFICEESDIKSLLENIHNIIDEPIADQSILPTSLVSQIASKYVKVVLSADGGDETFIGYDRYFSIAHRIKKISQLPQIAKSTLGCINDKIRDFNSNGSMGYYMGASKNFSNSEICSLLNISSISYHETFFDKNNLLNTNDYLNDMAAFDYKTYLLDNCLTKVDRATMYSSIEGREPLLDHRIIEYCASLSSDIKTQNGKISKFILKKIAHNYIPENIINKPKKGFNIPIDKWLKGDLSYIYNEYLDDKKMDDQGIFNITEIQNLKKHFLKNDNYLINNKIWSIIVFQAWLNNTDVEL